MKNIILNLFVCVVASLLFSSSASAAGAPKKKGSSLPITINSNNLNADNKGRTAIFTGKVVAKQGDVTIYSDKLTVYYGDKKEEVEKVEADGNVRIIQENRTGYGSHAVYESSIGKITLTGSPKVVQGSDTVTGKVIMYLVDEDRSLVTGDSSTRVISVIHPKSKQNNDAPKKGNQAARKNNETAR